ncbi:MAG: copper amine oxidase N-terminal domain-containing protein, partial [Armatimonadota bacterium]|nr:copper amine oxidase N-terminal domain-containing protein [Armatimonadota bacterium]
MHPARLPAVAAAAALLSLLLHPALAGALPGGPVPGNATKLTLDGRPVEGAVALPSDPPHIWLRPVVAAMGGTVMWDSTTRRASIRCRDCKAEVTAGERVATVEGKPLRLSAAPLLREGRLTLLAPDAARVLRLNLTWDAPAQTLRFASIPRRVLFFTKSSGFEHSVVKRNAGKALSWAEQILTEL